MDTDYEKELADVVANLKGGKYFAKRTINRKLTSPCYIYMHQIYENNGNLLPRWYKCKDCHFVIKVLSKAGANQLLRHAETHDPDLLKKAKAAKEKLNPSSKSTAHMAKPSTTTDSDLSSENKKVPESINVKNDSVNANENSNSEIAECNTSTPVLNNENEKIAESIGTGNVNIASTSAKPSTSIEEMVKDLHVTVYDPNKQNDAKSTNLSNVFKILPGHLAESLAKATEIGCLFGVVNKESFQQIFPSPSQDWYDFSKIVRHMHTFFSYSIN